jgi:hypothetical protein
MLKKTIEYIDLDGNDATVEVYFNLSRKNLFKMGDLFDFTAGSENVSLSEQIEAVEQFVKLAYAERVGDKLVPKPDEADSNVWFNDFVYSLIDEDGAMEAFIEEVAPKVDGVTAEVKPKAKPKPRATAK